MVVTLKREERKEKKESERNTNRKSLREKDIYIIRNRKTKGKERNKERKNE